MGREVTPGSSWRVLGSLRGGCPLDTPDAPGDTLDPAELPPGARGVHEVSPFCF